MSNGCPVPPTVHTRTRTAAALPADRIRTARLQQTHRRPATASRGGALTSPGRWRRLGFIPNRAVGTRAGEPSPGAPTMPPVWTRHPWSSDPPNSGVALAISNHRRPSSLERTCINPWRRRRRCDRRAGRPDRLDPLALSDPIVNRTAIFVTPSVCRTFKSAGSSENSCIGARWRAVRLKPPCARSVHRIIEREGKH